MEFVELQPFSTFFLYQLLWWNAEWISDNSRIQELPFWFRLSNLVWVGIYAQKEGVTNRFYGTPEKFAGKLSDISYTTLAIIEED